MPTALLVDLDDTLLNDRGAMTRAVLELRRRHQFAQDASDEELVRRWDAAVRTFWAASITDELPIQAQRRCRMRQVFVTDLPDDEADALAAEYLVLYERSWEPLPGVADFLTSTAHLPRVIVSNGHRQQVRRKMERCGLAGHFIGLVTPEDCGAWKPDPRIFICALQVLGVQANEAFMVGDNLEADIEPALALGMGAFHINASAVHRSLRAASEAILRLTPT